MCNKFYSSWVETAIWVDVAVYANAAMTTEGVLLTVIVELGGNFMYCKWCGNNTKNDKIKFCSKNCEEDFNKFILYIKKNLVKFYLIFFVGLITMIISLIILSANNIKKYDFIPITSYLIVLGILIIKFPFCTNTTINLIEAKKAIKSTKIFGGVIVLLGVCLLIFKN